MSIEDNDLDFEQIQSILKDLPMTWYPALLFTLVEESYAAGTWQDGGCSRAVLRKEADLGVR